MGGHSLVFTRARTAALASAMLIAACDDPKSTMPTAPGLPSFVSLTISGPDNVPPGQSAQLIAVIRLSDGTSKSATDDTRVRWTTGDQQRLRVDASGVVTASTQVGQTFVSAELIRPGGSRLRSSREVTVMPAGTYRLSGLVRELPPSTTQVIGARVEVVPNGPATTSLASGAYQLYGVPPQATIRVTATGYDSLEQNVQLTANTQQNFFINLIGPRLSLSGPFTLTIDAAGGCTGLPADLQHRSYEATVTQTGSSVDVRLTEPRFKLDGSGKGNRFTGTAFGANATFGLDSYSVFTYYGFPYISYPSVAEQLSNGNILVVEGFTIATQSGNGLSGDFTGGLALYDSRFPTVASPLGGCSSSTNRFTLSPR